jgi:UDP-2-acetamido-2,6-beta-L-arabino-hexul-4-ose reductase
MHLDTKRDNRGELVEFVKHHGFGQILVTRTRPGMTRGNHYHRHKVEKFLVVEGETVIHLRRLGTSEIYSTVVHGEDFVAVDIPIETVHSFENIGKTDLVMVIWANEVFDPKDSDTYSEEVCKSPQ